MSTGSVTPIELSTARLILRAWRESDREPFAALNADPRVMRYFPAPLSPIESDAMVARIEQRMAERGWGLWAVEVSGQHPFIGFVGLNVPSMDLPFSPCVEVGWRLAASHWGRGYASEAARAALWAAFECLRLDEIVSFTSLQNTPSQAVMRRIGMREDASARFEHPGIALDHPLRPHCLYRISRGEFHAPAGVTRRPRR